MAQQHVLKMEISDSCVFSQHLVDVGEVRIYLIEMGPSRGFMATRFENYGECHDWRLADEITDSVGTACFILDVEVEMLKVCGAPLMEVIMQFSLCLHELQQLLISVDDYILPNNVIPPLAVGLHNGVHLFAVHRVLTDNI